MAIPREKESGIPNKRFVYPGERANNNFQGIPMKVNTKAVQLRIVIELLEKSKEGPLPLPASLVFLFLCKLVNIVERVQWD